MSTQTEIERIKGNIAATYSALEGKGATMPATQNSANLAATVQSVEVGAPVPNTTAILKGNGAGGIVAATKGTDYSLAASYTATLTVSGWAQDSTTGLYAQSVSVTGLTASTPVVVVDVVLPTNDTDSRDLILAAWMAGAGANGTVQGAGTLTFYADAVPEVNIPISVGVVA